MVAERSLFQPSESRSTHRSNDRAVEAWRVASASSNRDAANYRAPRPNISRYQCGCDWNGNATPGLLGRSPARFVLVVAGRLWLRVVDCLRQRRELAAGPSVGTGA